MSSYPSVSNVIVAYQRADISPKLRAIPTQELSDTYRLPPFPKAVKKLPSRYGRGNVERGDGTECGT